MIHSVAPQRSDVPATPPGADPQPPSAPEPAAVDAPPGPISWELAPPSHADPPVPTPGQVPEGFEAPTSTWAEVRQHQAPGRADPAAAGQAPSAALLTPDPPSPRRAPRAEPPAPIDAGPEPHRAAATVHSLGPVGRRRSAVLGAAVSVVTLGLYPIAWARRANREMAQFDPRMSVRPGRTAAALAIAVVLPLLVAAAEGARIVADHLGHAPDLPVSAALTRWLLLAPALTPMLVVLLPFSLVAAIMTLERVRVVEDRAGADPDQQFRPAAAMGWVLLPVFGLAILVLQAQRRLNRVWVHCA